MTTLTLTNSFHNTSVTLKVRPEETWETISRRADFAAAKIPHQRSAADQRALRQRRRVRRVLCGISDCYCGTVRF